MKLNSLQQPSYEGKAKSIYTIEGNNEQVYLQFRNSLTALNGAKKGEFPGKGQLNRDITSLIYRYLHQQGVKTHFVKDDGDSGMIVKKVKIIPLEVVVRNVLAGSTAKKFALVEGTEIAEPLVEFFYKDDNLGDPFISDEQALMLKVASRSELKQLKDLALEINRHLLILFKAIDLRLIDFKLEFGKTNEAEIILADEITPDCCRLWHYHTNEKMDKDRFRRDLGGVQQAYEKVFTDLKKYWEEKI